MPAMTRADIERRLNPHPATTTGKVARAVSGAVLVLSAAVAAAQGEVGALVAFSGYERAGHVCL